MGWSDNYILQSGVSDDAGRHASRNDGSLWSLCVREPTWQAVVFDNDDSDDDEGGVDDAAHIEFEEFCKIIWPQDGYFCKVPAFGSANEPIPQ